MTNTYTYKNLTWIDVEAPTSDEIAALVKKYDLHALTGEELLSPAWKPRVDIYPNYLFLALQIPIRSNTKDRNANVVEKEIDFIIGKEILITSHVDTIEPLHSFAKSFETNSILDKKAKSMQTSEHAGLIFYYIMKKIYSHMADDLENIKDALATAEKHIFLGHERKMVEVLSELSRDLIDFKQTARLHRELLESFNKVPQAFFGDHFSLLVEDIKFQYENIHDRIANCHELLTDLRETNDSLLSTKQNESMRVLSILAFVTLPLSLITSIFSMNTSHTPILGMRYDFETIMGIMLIASLGMILFFKRKGWL